MKKLVTVLLVVAMVLSLASVAFAADFSDTKDLPKDTQNSIAKLSALQIINGYPDNTFKPANTITRAEFAKISVVLAGMETSADVLQNSSSKFSDVAAGQWYTGWINVAASQNYVKGFPDGTFRPNAKITYAQVVTVLMRVLGYNDNLPGPWPVDYIAKAGAEGVTDNVGKFDANADATRSDVAVMSDNTLDATVVEWDNDKDDFIYKKDKDGNKIDLLDENFDGAVNEDYIVEGWKYDKGTWKLKVKAWAGGDEDDQNMKDGTFDLSASCAISGASLVTTLKNQMIDIIYDTDEKEIVYIEVTSSFKADDEGDFSYDKSKKQFKIDGVKYDLSSGKDFYDGLNLDDLVTPAKGYYRAYLNSDDEVYFVEKRSDKNPGLVDQYKADREKLSFKFKGDQDYATYNFEDERVLVVKNNKLAKLEDLQENDVVYVTEGEYGVDYYLEAYSMDKNGKFNSYYEADKKVRIEGDKYELAAGFRMSRDNGDDFQSKIDFDDVYNSNVKFFLNKANQVSYLISNADGSDDDANTIYGVVTDIVAKNSVNDKITKIKVLNKEGQEVSYAIDTDEVELTYVNDPTQNQLGIDDFIKFKVNENNEIDSLTFMAKWVNGAMENPTAANLHMDAGDAEDYIDEDLDGAVFLIQDGDKDNDRVKADGSWYSFIDTTVVFNGYLNDKDDDDEAEIAKNSKVVDWADKQRNGGYYYAFIKYDGSDVKYMYIHDEVSAADTDVAAVLDHYVISGDKWVEVDINGETKTYELKNSSYPKDGNIYEYTITSNKFKYDKEVFDPDKVTASVVGYVYDVDTKKGAVKIYIKNYDATDDGVNNPVDYVGDGEGVWFFIDKEDTYIYDYTDWYDDGDDPVYCDSVSEVSEDDFVCFKLSNDKTDASRNIMKQLIIVNKYNK